MVLLLPSVRLPGDQGTFSVEVVKGRVAEVRRQKIHDPLAPLLLPGLVDSHLHLEKAFLLDRMPKDARNLQEAISMTSALKQGFTAADIADRSARVLDLSLAHGVTHVRCHVEVDDTLGMLAMETVLDLKAHYADKIDLNVVAFPQDGIFVQRQTAELMREALAMGADAVGGIPYNDRDVDEHLDFVFNLAAAHNKPLDFHIDLSDDPRQLDVLGVIERTVRHGLHGRVALGHLTSLGSVKEERAREIAAALAAAEISVITLPATDVFLNGRGDKEAQRRGITPVSLLLSAGVNVAVASNNIQNAFTPFGRGNIFDVANLLAELCHLGTAADADLIIDMLTTRPGKALGLESYGLRVGDFADFALFDAHTRRQVLLDREKPLAVYKRGRLVAEKGAIV